MAAVFSFANSYQTGFDAEDQVIEGLWAGNQVEGGGESSTLVEVGEPQLGSCKFPLHISILLRKQDQKISSKYYQTEDRSVLLLLLYSQFPILFKYI